MKEMFLLLFFSMWFLLDLKAQPGKPPRAEEKEPIAITEWGGSFNGSLSHSPNSYGPSVAVEFTPVEKWLEIECGFAPAFGKQNRQNEFDVLFKKPWTLSRKLELMLGAGLYWEKQTGLPLKNSTLGAECAMDWMYWPFRHRRFGFYVEPAYQFGFAKEPDPSIGVSAGLLVSIP